MQNRNPQVFGGHWRDYRKYVNRKHEFLLEMVLVDDEILAPPLWLKTKGNPADRPQIGTPE
ncbi:hypothetical protein TALK_20870 [Thalassospira alkalitolerans]|uniref:Uncharacterized protein n=1 Tax=Thalassospira alkalitolerans TaxID=1293890 RepID=A0A1Y2L5W9_9PROT|nr:hypothetical protein TALK_20870 [Thalassospira alkalitolerans]